MINNILQQKEQLKAAHQNRMDELKKINDEKNQKINEKKEQNIKNQRENIDLMMKEHNENMGQIRDQIKNDYNKHLNIMNNLNEECEKEKQKNNEKLQKKI